MQNKQETNKTLVGQSSGCIERVACDDMMSSPLCSVGRLLHLPSTSRPELCTSSRQTVLGSFLALVLRAIQMVGGRCFDVVHACLTPIQLSARKHVFSVRQACQSIHGTGRALGGVDAWWKCEFAPAQTLQAYVYSKSAQTASNPRKVGLRLMCFTPGPYRRCKVPGPRIPSMLYCSRLKRGTSS